jgi:hypothetical protein
LIPVVAFEAHTREHKLNLGGSKFIILTVIVNHIDFFIKVKESGVQLVGVDLTLPVHVWVIEFWVIKIFEVLNFVIDYQFKVKHAKNVCVQIFYEQLVIVVDD